jgi:TctA family transporter
MTPLGKLILIAMLWGVRFAAAAIAGVFAIVVWQKWLAPSAAEVTRQDYVFLAILALLFVAALWFARAVKKELAG